MSEKPGRVDCRVCGALVNSRNYERHLRKVHGRGPGADEKGGIGAPRRGRGSGYVGRSAGRLAEARRRRRAARIAGVSVTAVLLAALGLYYALVMAGDQEDGEGYQPATPTSSPPSSQEIRIPVRDLSTTAQFYTYDSGGAAVRYFLLEGTDGNIHLAADASDLCYKAKKGFWQKGCCMKCSNCGQEFHLNLIGTPNTEGGCWPSYLPMSLQDGQVVIQKASLDSKSFMFR
ncbi:MAG: DUF2318 domain-containing protein [Euryarchaeota archaeon]|nr:DUF2318 domain-containing protein [Euryarchaeota archaeon]